MNILKPGHFYELASFEGGKPQRIQFIEKREVAGSKKLETVADGTTNEELLKVLIDRLSFLNNKMDHRENRRAIKYLEEALSALERRNTERRTRGVEGTTHA